MNKGVFSKKQKIEICCGLDIIIPALIMGAISITQFWHQWYLGLIFTFAGVVLIFTINTKKYTLAKLSNMLNFKRVVIIDSFVTAFSLVFLWMYLYFPIPFSVEQFLNCSSEIVFPFGAWILGSLLLTPSLKTNKKILKFLSD